MKNYFKYILFFVSVLFFQACDDKNEKFSGSPVGKAEFVNVIGTVSTTETVVASTQNFEITVSIPNVFASDVDVEATTVAYHGSTRKSKIVIPAGQTSAKGKISAPVAIAEGNFIQSCDLYLSAIVPAVAEAGKQYTISSNKVTLVLGESSLPVTNSNRCIVRLDWQGPWGESNNPLQNNMDMIVSRNGVVYTTADPAKIPPSSANQKLNNIDRRYETFSILNDASYPDGIYSFHPYATSLNAGNWQNLQCRFLISYPDDKFKTVSFNYNGLVAPSLPSEKLKIRKTTTAAGVSYDIEP